jgi:hypothetical protein
MHQNVGAATVFLNKIIDWIEVREDILGDLVLNVEDQPLWVQFGIIDVEVNGRQNSTDFVLG